MKKATTRGTRARHELLRSMLEDRRRDIQQKLRYLREALPAESGDVRDTEEQSLDDFVQEVDFALMQMKSETLRRIDDALGRLEAGTYGQCSECEGEIAAARLKALPFAELCRDCQEAVERHHAEEEELRTIERKARIIESVLR
jgi:DnaK suppressor protein